RCLAEEDNMCLVSRALGVYQNGGYATHVVAPHPRHLIDAGTLDPALAATYACSGVTVYSAIRKVMPIPPDKPIVLIGAGGLGLAAVAVLKALGHRAIVSVDLSPEKRQAALDAGATKVVDASGQGVTDRIVEACGGPAEAIIDLVNGTATAAFVFVFFSSRRRHTRSDRDWSSDVCSSDLRPSSSRPSSSIRKRGRNSSTFPTRAAVNRS